MTLPLKLPFASVLSNPPVAVLFRYSCTCVPSAASPETATLAWRTVVPLAGTVIVGTDGGKMLTLMLYASVVGFPTVSVAMMVSV